MLDINFQIDFLVMGHPGVPSWTEAYIELRGDRTAAPVEWLLRRRCSIAMVLEKNLQYTTCWGPLLLTLQAGEPNAQSSRFKKPQPGSLKTPLRSPSLLTSSTNHRASSPRVYFTPSSEWVNLLSLVPAMCKGFTSQLSRTKVV